MPAAADSKQYLTILTKQGIYFDHCIPFGLSPAAGILGVATDTTIDIICCQLPISFFIKWVDDLLPTCTPTGQCGTKTFTYNVHLNDISDIITSLGWCLKASKTCQFSSTMTYIGFFWDIAQREVSVLDKKVQKHLGHVNALMANLRESP